MQAGQSIVPICVCSCVIIRKCVFTIKVLFKCLVCVLLKCCTLCTSSYHLIAGRSSFSAVSYAHSNLQSNLQQHQCSKSYSADFDETKCHVTPAILTRDFDARQSHRLRLWRSVRVARQNRRCDMALRVQVHTISDQLCDLHEIDTSVVKIEQKTDKTRNVGQCPAWWPPCRI